MSYSKMGYANDLPTSRSNGRSAVSVLSFGTARSSRFSRKSRDSTAEAMAISHATAQAAQAAKAILNAGGSELTALKTAKAAAVSALMPESAENEISHGIGTSFLRRRKLKRQADVVASMALASAMAGVTQSGDMSTSGNTSPVAQWDLDSPGTLQGLKIVNDPTRAETLSTKESNSSGSDEQSSQGQKRRQRATEIITQQLKLIPSLAQSLSAASFSAASSRSGSKSEAEGEADKPASVVRQVSTISESPRDDPDIEQMPSPQNLPPRNRMKSQQYQQECQQQQAKAERREKRAIYRNDTSCLGHTFSDDVSVDSDAMSLEGPVDTMLRTIAHAISCTPILGHKARNVQVEAHDEDEQEYEETITFDDYGDGGDDFQGEDEAYEAEEADHDIDYGDDEDGDEDDDDEEEDEEDIDINANANVIVNSSPNVNIVEERKGAKPQSPVMKPSKSAESEESLGTTSDEILLDLLASATQSSFSRPPGVRPPAVLTSNSRNTIELQVPNASDSVDELSMSGASRNGRGPEHDQNAHYVQLVEPLHRSRRLSRGYKMLGNEAPPKGSESTKASGLKLFRKKKWRRS